MVEAGHGTGLTRVDPGNASGRDPAPGRWTDVGKIFQRRSE